MKLKALLAVLFVAGLAASFALASPADGDRPGKRTTTGTTGTTATTTGTTTTAKPRCKQVQLQGTASAATFTMTVQKASKRARGLQNATLKLGGKVQVVARMCSATGTIQGATFEVRSLRVKGAKDDD